MDYKYEKENNRIAVYDEENTLAGEMTYQPKDGYWVADHTFVNPAFRGQGIAQQLMAKMAESARAEKVKIEPLCSFAVKMMDTDESLADLKR